MPIATVTDDSEYRIQTKNNLLSKQPYVLSVTKYSTVYTALRNFEDIRKQLNQEYFPVISDEGFDQIVMDIFLNYPLLLYVHRFEEFVYAHWEKY